MSEEGQRLESGRIKQYWAGRRMRWENELVDRIHKFDPLFRPPEDSERLGALLRSYR